MGEIQLVNGNWIETIAHLINDKECTNNCCTGETQTTVIVEEYVNGAPKTIVTTVVKPKVTNEPSIVYRKSTTVVPTYNYVTKIINGIDLLTVQRELCGFAPSNNYAMDCFNCVERFFNANPDAVKGDYTLKNTGCGKCKKK